MTFEKTAGQGSMSVILEPLECPASDVASVPRRFGMGVLLILVTAFAVLFAAMRTIGVPPGLFVLVAVLFLGVTLGQILLFKGKRPREASLLVGGILFPLEMPAVDWYVAQGYVAIWRLGWRVAWRAGRPLFGYLAGGVMAGVFLCRKNSAADRARR